jgi:hypothetical protein
MTEKQPTAKRRKEWREARARLRLQARLFPAPPKVLLTPEERRQRKTAAARQAREAAALAAIDFTSPQFHPDGRNIARKPAPKRQKAPERRASGPWD